MNDESVEHDESDESDEEELKLNVEDIGFDEFINQGDKPVSILFYHNQLQA